ncbi:unnamed protein product [Symbiodinium pilosum]|uniref:Uncharacterized protein n=1 Tax=Symbiodinium pilosum TaxID=2952 RepID=A0A812V4P9_SYMPI|nr:unnamed protein product [Symbiodinium pilosum]
MSRLIRSTSTHKKLERGNASKARRPLCAGTPVSPALGYGDDRLFLRDAC